MSDQYYRMFPGDYLRDTGDLTLLEHGAYMVMLHHYYTAESLPVEKERLYRICRAFTKPEQQAIDTVVERYFRENGNGHLINRRAEKELAERKTFKELQSEKGKKSAEKRWGKKDTQTITTVTPRLQPNGNLPSPSPSPSIKKEEKDRAAPDLLAHQKQLIANLHSQCVTINSLPPKQGSFNPHQWIQWAVNKKYHPGAISLVLDNLISYWDSIKSPWTYATKIIAKESGNYFERDATAGVKQEKNEWLDLVNKMKAVQTTKDFSTK